MALLALGCGLSPEGTNPQGVAGSGGMGPGGASAGSTSSSGSGGIGGEQSGGAGGSKPENCINGVDDDGDGLVDCDDQTDCADYLCTAMPMGDYVVLGDAQGGCPAGYTPDAVYDCTKCGCGVSCKFTVDLYNAGMSCGGSPVQTFDFDPALGSCKNINPDLSTEGGGFGFKASPLAGTDQCKVNAADTRRTICRPAGVGSCASGTKVCVPIPPAQEISCVVTADACAPPFLKETTVHEGASESTCGCSCGGMANCTGWTITQYKDQDDCGGHSHNGKSDGSCGVSNDDTFMSFGMAELADTCAGSASPASAAKRLCCGQLAP